MEDNDKYIQLPQKDAVKNIKIMYLYPLNRKMFSVKVTDFSLLLRFVFFLSGLFHDSVDTGFYPEALVSRKLFLGERTYSALFATCE